MNAPRKYDTIKTDAPGYLLVILSHYSFKSDGSCLVCLPSLALPLHPAHAHKRRFESPPPPWNIILFPQPTAEKKKHRDFRRLLVPGDGNLSSSGGLLWRRTRHGAATGGRHPPEAAAGASTKPKAATTKLATRGRAKRVKAPPKPKPKMDYFPEKREKESGELVF